VPSSETLGVPAWSWTGGASGVHPGEAGGRSPGMIDVILALCLSLMTLPPPSRVPVRNGLPAERHLLDGNRPDEERWYTVLDGVMGGRSTGSSRMTETGMVFEGVLNTSGGGGSSIRRGATDLRLGQPGERGLPGLGQAGTARRAGSVRYRSAEPRFTSGPQQRGVA